MIEFNGSFFQGTHESVVFVAPELQTVRSGFAGVTGESEIRLGSKGRPLFVPIWIHNKYATSEALFAELDRMDLLVGDHGELRIQAGPYGGLPRVFRHCTFEGFQKEQSPDSGPLADQIGLLDGAKPSWWVKGLLVWRQLSISD